MRIARLAAVLPLLAAAHFALADDLPAISTFGTATVYAAPDIAYISISVETTREDLDQAKTDNQAKTAKLVAAIKDAGIDAPDLATERLNLAPHFKGSGADASRERDGYTVSQSLTVTIKDLKKVQPLIEAVFKTGTNAASVSFDVQDMRKHRDKARELALIASREKADAMAKQLGCTIGKPRKIQEGAFDSAYGGGNNSFSASTPPPNDTPESLPVGRIAIVASVAVTYELK